MSQASTRPISSPPPPPQSLKVNSKRNSQLPRNYYLFQDRDQSPGSISAMTGVLKLKYYSQPGTRGHQCQTTPGSSPISSSPPGVSFERFVHPPQPPPSAFALAKYTGPAPTFSKWPDCRASRGCCNQLVPSTEISHSAICAHHTFTSPVL